jgi:hypothetical protein
MDYCFDTSGLNRLHDDPNQESIVTGLIAANQALVTALNIREAVATDDAARRISLMRLQRRLSNGLRPLRTPIELLREVTVARIQNRTSVTLTIDESSQGLWWALEEPEGLSAELQQESYEWKKNLEDQFTEAHRRARPELQKVFTLADRPKSLAKLLRLFYYNPKLLLPTVSAVYQSITGAPLDMRCLLEVFSALTEWPLYMAGWAQGMYARALQGQGYGPRRNAGTIDLWFAVYLAHCDFMVTDDRAQYKALRVINMIGKRRRPRAKVLLYDQFRKRLVLSSMLPADEAEGLPAHS